MQTGRPSRVTSPRRIVHGFVAAGSCRQPAKRQKTPAGRVSRSAHIRSCMKLSVKRERGRPKSCLRRAGRVTKGYETYISLPCGFIGAFVEKIIRRWRRWRRRRSFSATGVTADNRGVGVGVGFMPLKKRQAPVWGRFEGLKSWERYYFR